MTDLRFRGAVAPLRRAPAQDLPRDVAGLVAALRPEAPLHCLRPATVAGAAESFLAAFPGTVMYAVKCNPEPAMLRALWAGGVRHFDCASAGEVRLVRTMFPEAEIHFMHPVKARGAIREAHGAHGVRDFVLDSRAELDKILAETGGRGLNLIIRLGLPKGNATYDLSGKFGAEPAEAAALLRAARPHAGRLGVSFHVGSQCLDPGAYARAIALAAEVIRDAGVAVEVLDVGGGFPVAYPDVVPPPLSAFMAAIRTAFAAAALPGVELWAEPGRALVAGGASVVVQVQARRDGMLFINDGVYGALSDAGVPGFRFPVKLIRPGSASTVETVPFSFFGPTCDTADRMEGPFLLPADVAEGDWIEIGQLGAYGACLRTAFNGFDRAGMVEVADAPLLHTPGYGRVALAA
ncbi:type III PLP-dependent enzyme domain-containing protein [Falsiroseomonas selenitidurans]|uniref:ornithine decarboxylase n=1 Tax=Falsiroseomonas selenitidurans TaxID=2716335 RepID=A0ABX1E0V8_9PROT|nr:type III PLP-dependent enzyme [Falsiroseomonas selenitidurans]NKC30796.1 type III PLP-dependent enzyme [Falsiroseomonas selenitidurans]